MDRPHFCLNLEQCFRAKNRIQFLEHLATIHPEKHRPLTRAVRHTQLDSHQKPIQLRFGQWKRSHLILWILCRDDKKRPRQFVSDAIGRDLMFFHRFEQCALRLGGGAVHFIDQHYLRKERSLMKNETLFVPIKN